MSGGELPEYPKLRQLQVERWEIAPSNQPQGLQSCKGGAAAQEEPTHNKPGIIRVNILPQIYNARVVVRLCSVQLRGSEQPSENQKKYAGPQKKQAVNKISGQLVQVIIENSNMM
jgi:hypothetical protein